MNFRSFRVLRRLRKLVAMITYARIVDRLDVSPRSAPRLSAEVVNTTAAFGIATRVQRTSDGRGARIGVLSHIAEAKVMLLTASVVVMLCGFSSLAWAITGDWAGVLSDQDNKQQEVAFGFSADGGPIIPVRTRVGVQRVELREVGQRAEWRLPGSGWARGRVLQLSIEANRVRARVEVYSERNLFADRLSQKTTTVTYEFVQQGGVVRAAIAIDERTSQTGAGLGVRESSSQRVLRGTLHRADREAD